MLYLEIVFKSPNEFNCKLTFQSLPTSSSYTTELETTYVSDYGYDINIYLVQYNILSIQNGIGALQFS